MKQFNFARNWRKRIAPLLDKPTVIQALTMGMMMQGDGYEEGDPPWLHGRGPLNGQRARKGCLSWYQPWGRCHFIAPFSWALGMELYPDLNWGIVTSDRHSVAIGYRDKIEEPKWVFDILLFRIMTAQESMAFATSEGWGFSRNP